MDLESRLALLLSSGAISKDVFDSVRLVVARLAERWNIVLTEDNGSRLVTHLAMALMRIRRGEPVNSMDADAYGEFCCCGSFAEASEISADLIVRAGLELPRSEQEYLITNICLILEGE